MIRRGLLAVAIAALAGCGSSAPNVGAQFSGPTDVVPFRGITVDSPDVRDYLAVASGRGNELRIVDLASDKAVLGPTVVFPLSIPSVPRPVRLAAASLGDDKADLLVASSAGSATIELVLTWGQQNKISETYDLSVEAAAGSAPEVLALAAAPVPGPPGKARVIAALSGGKLVVVTATRAEDGSIALVHPAVVRDVGFDAVDLAVTRSSAAATTGLWLFAATPDDLDPGAAELFGVAQIEISGDPSAWTPVALDARAPTRLVGAAEVAERVVGQMRPDDFQPDAPLRVYAALDPTGCGLQRRINCGLVTLDPVTRTLAPDPAGEMDHRAPMPINGVPLGMTIATQPVNPAPSVCNDAFAANPAAAPPFPKARLLIAPGTGQRCTSAVAAVTSSDGFVYVYDLGRWSPPNDTSILRTNSRVRATGATLSRPLVDPATDIAPLLGFWNGDDENAVLTATQTDLTKWFRVTPGYTPSETFHIGYQIPLPEMQARGAVIGALGDGRFYLAAQADAGRDPATGNTIWALGPRLSDPANGLRVGDAVLLVTTGGSTTCAADANGAFPETTVAEVLPPDPVRFPGGAVVLAPLATTTGCWEAAVAQSATGLATASFTIRSSDLLLYGERLGYLGRPQQDVRFELRWRDETTLTGEELAVTRKLRRFYYPGAEKCDITTPCPDLGSIDPMTPGPMLSFRAGYVKSAVRTGDHPVVGEQVIVTTQSGVSPMSRKPVGSGALPLGIAPVDRSAFIGEGEPIRFYTAYQDDQVYVFSPGQALSQGFSIR